MTAKRAKTRVSDLRIVKAAVRHQGVIYIGLRHGQIMQDVHRDYPGQYIPQEEQGFLTDDGRFLTPWQAGLIAFAAGQTKKRKEILLSEDLW